MKKFNTERIRQRMREQKERFPPSKGNLLSAPPVRILPPPVTGKENSIPFSIDTFNGAENTTDGSKKSKRFPQLAISITMSEAEDEEKENLRNEESMKVSDDEDEEDDNSAPSAWAMMEHYQDFSEDEDICNRISNSPCAIKDTFSKDKPLPENTAADPASKELSRSPPRIHWSDGGDGGLIQSPFYTQDDTFEIRNINTTDGMISPTTFRNDKNLIFRQDNATCFSDQAIIPEHASESLSVLDNNFNLGQPTPAKVRQNWVEAENEDLSTNPDSLLQESMIKSAHSTFINEDGSHVDKESVSHGYVEILQNEEELSRRQYPESSNVPSLQDSSAVKAVSESNTKPSAALTLVTVNDELKIDDLYLDRIGELESNLKVQQNNTDQVQNRLKERVMELEQALKVTAATPRGTVIDENPLKTLLNRNQTLVKEVRFADQTCVELSSKITELEMHNDRLQDEVDLLAKQKEKKYHDFEEKESIKSEKLLEQESIIGKLKQEINVTNENLRIKATDEDNIRNLVAQALGNLDFRKGSPCLSLASSIISERESVFSGHSLDTDESLEKQIEELIKIAKGGNQTEELKREMNELKRKNESNEQELYQLRMKLKLSSESSGKNETSNDLLQIQNENEFLGRQLGKVQEKLDDTHQKLGDERQKSEMLQLHLKRDAEAYARLIEPLERRLIDVSQYDSNLHGMKNVDEHFFLLEKELAHVKASIAAMKDESKRVLALHMSDTGMSIDANQRSEVLSMVQASILRIGQRYKQLDNDLDRMVVNFSDRLEKLTVTVSFLRSTLMFEKESVPSVVPNFHGKNTNCKQQSDTSVDLINATIPIQNYSTNNEDEIYELMEEARSPRTHDISISSDLDDVSRLLCDDLTVGSILRAGSVISSGTNLDQFKQSLETAMVECRRVKERSSKLKDQVEAQKVSIHRLEQENGRLSLNASRKSEEHSLIERAVEEAKTEIEELRCQVLSIQNEKEVLCQQLKEEEREKTINCEEKEQQIKNLMQVQKEKETFEVRINELESSFAENKMELEFATRSCNEYKNRFEILQLNLSNKINSVIEQKELESAETHRSLKVALRETSELKVLHRDLEKKLSQEIDSKLKFEATVNGFQNAQLQAQSDAEDKDLESQYEYENMRKERAELKCKLSLTEKELFSLKESYLNLKTKTKAQVEDHRNRSKRSESEKIDLLSNISQLTQQRKAFNRSLLDLKCCQDLSQFVGISEECQSEIESAVKEINYWKVTIPLIGKEIKAMQYSINRIPQLEAEINNLSNDKSTRDIHETDQMKLAVEQKEQNEKLFALLRQAEIEMERSTWQIKEMSEAMAEMQQRESDAIENIDLLESELNEVKDRAEKNVSERMDELRKVKSLLLEASSTLEEKESQLLQLNSKLNCMKSEVDDATSHLRSKENEERSLKINFQSCEKKNGRLREYIRKLTLKCESWEDSYDRQTKHIDRLQEKNVKIRAKANDIAGRYRSLVGDLKTRKKLHLNDREHWRSERSNLHDVHAALEQELQNISEQLFIEDN